MCLQMVTHNFILDEYQMAAILDLGMKGTSHTSVDGTIVSGVPENPMIDIKSILLLHSYQKLCAFVCL